jgi:C1A family cysteine protease
MAKIFAIVIVSLMIGVSLAQTPEDKWAQFKGRHGKLYKDKNEETRRKQKFLETDAKIEKNNREFAAGKKSFEMGHNQFSDMEEDEKESYLGLKEANNTRSARAVSTSTFTSYLSKKKHFIFKRTTSVTLPTSIDYTSKWNAPARDQGQCGSCWAFATVGAVEAALKLKKGVTVDLAEQKLVDCAADYYKDDGGCNGFYVSDTFDYVIAKSLPLESASPYSAKERTCTSFTKTTNTIKDFYRIEPNNEEALKEALVSIGPVAVCLHCSLDTFYNYKSGIWDGYSTSGQKCSEKCAHAVVLIGYGVEKGTNYYLVRNSWGTKWGMAGYFKIRATGSNLCGVAKDNYVPIV